MKGMFRNSERGDRPGNLFREDWAEEPIGSDTQE